MNKVWLVGILLSLSVYTALAQSEASIVEETMSIDTYPFHTPNPIPIVVDNPKIPPYFKFEGYSHTTVKKDWNVVTLENDYIKLWVLPEIGGKVWGAIEKKTGEEFLYKNEVIKFRNIAMRGPWTSGGIEFNFGIIGHHPSTATPVDYHTQTNADGSVSCIVGNTDLPSNTKWIVEIRLEKDKAYFETNASWYNASPLTESYYNWMTAAAVATNDLEFFIPGNKYVEHNGDAHPWPIDEEGRNLAMYKNNTFGPAKSYHVVGEYNDFFGGYYHDKNFGYGQWSPYEEMPGQKLWLWALSRSGGIWEDLLTDSDGQYIEFQAGRLFDQYSSGAVNPISQVGFDPYVMDTWSEIWFPFKEIGGMEDASKHGVLNVEYEDGLTYVGVNALQNLNHELQIKINGDITFSEKLNLKPMEVFSTKLPTSVTDAVEISVLGTELEYTNNAEAKRIKRPFYPDTNLKISKSEALYQAGLEALEYREYALAHDQLSELVTLDPSHRSGLLALAELEYRRTNYERALALANTVLKMDTYNSKANYIAGITYRALGDFLNALESLGWAARDIKYRSVAYAQMGEIHLKDKNYKSAKMYGSKALTYNLNNINAREILLFSAKSQGDEIALKEYAQGILSIDPLNFLAKQELNRRDSKGNTNTLDLPKIHNELPQETILGLALRYHELGYTNEALVTLLEGSKSIKNRLWIAFLQKDTNPAESQRMLNKALSEMVNFVFPYRRETIPVLEWATQQSNSWKLTYYLAQNYLVVGKMKEAEQLLKTCANEPDSDIFYRFRAKIYKDKHLEQELADYQKAYDLNSSDWKVNEEFIQFYLANNMFQEAVELSSKAYKKFPKNYNIGLAHAKALLNTGKFKKVIDVLQKIQVLPFEHASESREIYERAHVAVALSHLKKNRNEKAVEILKLSKQWPENIGVGKPYDPDERLQDYLIALAMEKMEKTEDSKTLFKKIVDKTENTLKTNNLNHLYGLLAAKRLDNGSLEKLITSLKATKNVKSKTAFAIFNKDVQVLNDLKVEIQLPHDVWEITHWATQN